MKKDSTYTKQRHVRRGLMREKNGSLSLLFPLVVLEKDTYKRFENFFPWAQTYFFLLTKRLLCCEEKVLNFKTKGRTKENLKKSQKKKKKIVLLNLFL